MVEFSPPKMGCKASETMYNISNAFGPGTANEHTVQWWFKKSCKGDESLEDEVHSWQHSSKLFLLQLHEKFLQNSTSTILQSFSIWSKLERWKSLISGCLMSWIQIKEIITLKCHLLLFYTTTMNHFLSRFWCVTKSGFYTTTGNDRLSGCT